MILAWRDIAVRCKQTIAGAVWAIIQPPLNMINMTVIFGFTAGLSLVAPDPFGRVIVEAMLCGKPVAATIPGGLKEIVEPVITGLLLSF